jgi:peptide/nickel transport system substrate-binding protein
MISPKVLVSRRKMLAAAAAGACFAHLGPLSARSASARGRTTVGGRVTLHVPWPLGAVDPHRIDDGCAAILGEALFDTLYARDAGGAFVPVLAESEPELDGGTLKVNVRGGLKTARGHVLDARDVAFSISRARAAGARAWLAEVPPPRVDGKSTLLFASKDPTKLVRALASPLLAIVPNNFTPAWPDGTGPFRAERRADGLLLQRNPLAARGPAFLDEVFVRPSGDLAESLRAFETGADDVGWLGMGLHEPRPGAKPFDAGHVGWALLFTGRDVAGFDAPGVAQRLCDELPPQRLSYLALGAPWPTETAQGWGGPPSTIIVRDDCPWLVELARSVAAILSRPSHEIVAKPVAPPELAQRRASRNFPLAIDFARPLAHGTLGALVALATADNPGAAEDTVKHPPRLGDVPVRTLTRSMRAGVIGEVRVQGGRVPDLSLATSVAGLGLDLAATTRGRK